MALEQVPPKLGNREIIRTKIFAVEAADFIVQRAREALDTRGEFRVALSGGNTPRAVYSEMAKRDLPWEKFQFSFGDERCVPPENEKSNFRMANEALFQPASVPESSILRMRGEVDPSQGADEYQGRLDALAAKRDEKIYQHDLILLGLGDDGHTASLVPGDPVLQIDNADVAVTGAYQGHPRMTLTYPTIDRSRRILWLVTDADKAGMLVRLCKGDQSIPAGRVRQDTALIVADRGAAEKLGGSVGLEAKI